MERAKKIVVLLWVVALLVLPFSTGGLQCAKAAENKEEGASGLQPYVKSENGNTEAYGVSVTTKFDKDSYKDGETAQVTLEVKNGNDYDVTDLNINYKLPNNFQVTEGNKTQKLEKLAAGETKQLTVKATVTEDANAPLVKGAYNLYIYIGVAVVVVIIVVVFLLLSKKKKRKGALSVFLAFVLSANAVMVAQPLRVCAAGQDAGENARTEKSDALTTETGNYKVNMETFYSRTSVHDPSIVKDPKSGMYYIFGSHLAFSKSKNLIEWEGVHTNVQTDYEKLFKEPWDEWAGPATESGTLSGMMWAPDVIWNDTMKKWCMYMSINGDNWVSSICLLTADKIEGPYKYEGIVVYSGINNPNKMVDVNKTDIYKVLDKDDDLSRYASTAFSCINAIDPNVRYDDDGSLYMTYGSWSAGIFQLKLDPKTGLRDYNTTYETKRDVSDAYFGTKIAGGYYCSGEGPYILHTGDYYYLFLSYANLEAMGGYQMRIYRSENISGPYVDQNGVSAIRTEGEDVKMTDYGLRILGSYDMYGLSEVQVAQGHNSAFVDDDGRMYLIYHTRFQSDTGKMERHQVRVHQMFVNKDGWLVAAPYEYSGEKLSDIGYAMEDMAGTYEFIYHEPTSYYKVVGDKQLGIVGRTKSTKKIEGAKEICIGKHISTVSYAVSFVQNRADTVTLNEDGTVTGTYHGKWEYDGANMKLDLGDGYVFQGVFLKQANEYTHSMTMTFTVEGKNVAVWGIKPLFDDEQREEE